ncbi:hypothetical protein Snoj_17180 [Streptomyces nojiriensis]|uniref:Uncharacterized protein n=1 Tax=Streptomyces nojiriensis TaxID=66374 RepID=A0ABQ3SIW4_9ACTN|nr:hypothetical protein [Streptomyces nojiriensis]QTI49421.1 hypothetical protein JYK04_07293 [Streptomyces nojiriensis]GGS38669.1 hypothetical protein GCM10010205_80520 [Streptomyces nojiriensis]GHI67800.1 hypothetical protein Snoj_17180 [Streptomyces nojiriensis]
MSDIPLAEEALRRVLAVADRTAELATELATALRMRPDDAAVRTAAIPLGVDVPAFGPAEFEALARHLELLDQLIAAVPPGADGMRWRYLDEAVLFRCDAEMGTPFDEFTARVDISRVIGLTSGYLSGRTEVLARDETGRPVRQLERSISRAQPAHLALAGADVVDVCKLETIDYGPDEQVLRWRQVHSANGSAVQDDGSVLFARTPGGGTGVTICAQQQFVLPPLWRAITPVLWPAVRRALVEDAYRKSFGITLRTIAARGQGSAGPVDEGAGATSSLWGTVSRLAGPLILSARSVPWKPTRPECTDSSGFRHFSPERQPL